MSAFKDKVELEKCLHIVKLLDDEDRHILFELLFGVLKQDKKQTASIMGVTQGNIDHALDERRKKPYSPKPESAAKILVYLANKVAASMDNSENERELQLSIPTKETLIALKDYKSKAENYDADFAASWTKIIDKLRSEERILHGLWEMNWHDYLCPEVAKKNSLQANISAIEQLNARVDKVKKLCSEKNIPQQKILPAILEVIAKFPEDKWLLLLDRASRLSLTPKLMQSMGDFLISNSNKGPLRSVWLPQG